MKSSAWGGRHARYPATESSVACGAHQLRQGIYGWNVLARGPSSYIGGVTEARDGD